MMTRFRGAVAPVLVVLLGGTLVSLAADPAAPVLLPKETSDALIRANAGVIIESLKDKKPAKPLIAKAKRTALLIAALAQEQAADKAIAPVAATTRDAALKLLERIENDEFGEATQLARSIEAGLKANPSAKLDRIKFAPLTDVDTLMDTFKPTKTGGMGFEATLRELKEGKVKLTPATKDSLENAIGHAVLLGKLSEEVKLGKAKQDWDGWAKDTQTAGKDALRAIAAGNDADLKKAITAMDTSCVACHNKYR